MIPSTPLLHRCGFVRRLPPLLLGVAWALGLGPRCTGDGPATGADSPARSIRARQWDTLWVRGGIQDDTLLQFPWAITADSELVYVLDVAAYRVLAFHAEDGSLAWSAGRKGSGPGEFASLEAVEVGSRGQVFVADGRNGRLAVLSREGDFIDHIRVADVSSITSLCALADGSVLLATDASEKPLLHLSGKGEALARFEAPWPDLDSLPNLVKTARLRSTPGNLGCLLALRNGRGFAHFQDGAFRPPHSYVEWFNLPPVQVKQHDEQDGRPPGFEYKLIERRTAALDLAFDGTSLIVPFEGLTGQAGRLIDIYDLATWEYQKTYVFPQYIHGLAAPRGTYFILHNYQGYPTLLAASPREQEVRP